MNRSDNAGRYTTHWLFPADRARAETYAQALNSAWWSDPLPHADRRLVCHALERMIYLRLDVVADDPFSAVWFAGKRVIDPIANLRSPLPDELTVIVGARHGAARS